MTRTQKQMAPGRLDLPALGLIVTCSNAACRRRSWLDVHSLEQDATVVNVGGKARCRVCGTRGAHVAVIQPVAKIGEQCGVSGPRNIEHAARIRKYVEEFPVSPTHPRNGGLLSDGR
jgi:hypothetical protein